MGVITKPCETVQAEDTAAVLCEVIDALATVDSLAPGPVVDGLFTRLVGTVVGTSDDLGRDVLADPGIQARADRIRQIAGRGEQELEVAWSTMIVASPTPRSELARFPYLDNYRRLSLMEAGVLTGFLGGPDRSLAFVGCGPLPLSALFLAGDLGAVVDGFDHDVAAVDAARRVAMVAGDHPVRFHVGDATNIDVSGYDVVVLAALVGSTPAEKSAILARLARTMTPGTILLARSVRGLRTLLYPPLDVTALAGFEVLTVVHPINDLVNSIVVARATGEV